MANYLPSLDERRKKLIEDCCGGMGGGDMQGATGDIEPPLQSLKVIPYSVGPLRK